jgi:phosphoribosylamine--glycine ligase
VAIGVVLAQPRYPYNVSQPDLVEGNPIAGLEENYDSLHCVSVIMGKGPKMDGGKVAEGPVYQTSGEYVLVATGLGKTIKRARAKVYGTIDGVHFPDMMYRTDIGEKVIDSLPSLHRFGYLMDMIE